MKAEPQPHISPLPLALSPPLPPAQPQRQVEVQLGHLCNNRCVFCVSGQLSEQGRAAQLAVEPILAEIRQARADGAQRITLLGGEPTIQRSFGQVLAQAVALDFAEVVIFTNGVMTPRESFRLRVLAALQNLGPAWKKRVLWRFSLQGGDEASHDATTLNPGSWKRILDSMAVLQGLGSRLSGNMCVVESNYRSIDRLAAVCKQYGLENLHLDMVRPRDAGDRTDAELQAMMPRYTAMAPHFLALSQQVDSRLGRTWDLNFGNVPFCTALDVAHRIHHDGQDTVTVAADGQGNTQQGFDKYLDKRSDKGKPPSCSQCVFDATCSGVFDKYRQFYGDSEFQPVQPEALWQRDGLGHHFARLAQAPLQQQTGLQLGQVDERAGEIEVRMGPWLGLVRRAGRPSSRPGWWLGRSERWELSLLGPLPAQAPPIAALHQGFLAIAAALGGSVPQGPDLGQAFRQALHLQARQRLEAGQRQHAEALAAHWRACLCAEPLAGLQAVQTAQGQALLWQDGPRSLELDIAAWRDPTGRWQPRIQHRAAGLSEAELTEANRAIAKKIRDNALSAPSVQAIC